MPGAGNTHVRQIGAGGNHSLAFDSSFQSASDMALLLERTERGDSDRKGPVSPKQPPIRKTHPQKRPSGEKKAPVLKERESSRREGTNGADCNTTRRPGRGSPVHSPKGRRKAELTCTTKEKRRLRTTRVRSVTTAAPDMQEGEESDNTKSRPSSPSRVTAPLSPFDEVDLSPVQPKDGAEPASPHSPLSFASPKHVGKEFHSGTTTTLFNTPFVSRSGTKAGPVRAVLRPGVKPQPLSKELLNSTPNTRLNRSVVNTLDSPKPIRSRSRPSSPLRHSRGAEKDRVESDSDNTYRSVDGKEEVTCEEPYNADTTVNSTTTSKLEYKEQYYNLPGGRASGRPRPSRMTHHALTVTELEEVESDGEPQGPPPLRYDYTLVPSPDTRLVHRYATIRTSASLEARNAAVLKCISNMKAFDPDVLYENVYEEEAESSTSSTLGKPKSHIRVALMFVTASGEHGPRWCEVVYTSLASIRDPSIPEIPVFTEICKQ